MCHFDFPKEESLVSRKRVEGAALSAFRRQSASDRSVREFRDRFFRTVQQSQQFFALCEYLPDVDFFAKDADGRFTAVSKRTLQRVGVEREEELLGKCDDAIHPPNVAKAIREDDLRVMRTREPLVDRVEALYARTRAKEWFLTTKVPLFNASGEVVGILGFVRPYRGACSAADPRINSVVTFIQSRFRERLNVAELARMAHISERQLNRLFQETFRISVQEFITRTRVQAASDALIETDRPVVEIAHDGGFCDQAAFTKHFRKHVGETPLAFRRRNSRPRASS